MGNFATTDDVILLWRPLSVDELKRANALLKVVSDTLRMEADKVGKDLDKTMVDKPYFVNVIKSVTVDIVARTLMTSTRGEPMAQESQSALGYTWSGTYLVPGGGLFIKDSELKRLGLKNNDMEELNFMAKLKGITVALADKSISGKDPFGNPVTVDFDIKIENVLVAPATTEDITNQLSLTGKKVEYVLAIPKGDEHDWENKEVRFFGKKWRTVGIPLEGIEELIPLDWNKKVMVERYE